MLNFSNGTRRMVWWLVAFAAFSLLKTAGAFRGIDAAMTGLVSSFANPALDSVFWHIRLVGQDHVCAALVLVIAAYAFFRKSKRFALVFLAAYLLLAFTGGALKDLTKQERPARFYHVKSGWQSKPPTGAKKSFSYPSGHSLRTLFLFSVAAALVKEARHPKRRKDILCGALYGLIILIGISSIYLGAHWLSDVIGSYLFGYVFYLGAIQLGATPLPGQPARSTSWRR